MQFVDFSPSDSPSLAQQRDALQKGLGRTFRWASSGHLADAPLLEACVQDKRYDIQCEDSRDDWLWNLIRVLGAQDRFREPLYAALTDLSDERSANQLCRIGLHFAKAGDERFRSRLYEIVATKPVFGYSLLGEEEIITLDGEQAFLFAARVRGERMATIPWDWDDDHLVDNAIDRLGRKRVVTLLVDSGDSHITRFYEKWVQHTNGQPRGSARSSHGNRMRAISVNEIIDAATNDDNCYWFRGWGMRADDRDLDAILAAVCQMDDPRFLSRLLKVFSNRALPRFDARLIDLCRHDDEQVRCQAFIALANNSNAAIRRFALEQIEIEATGPVVGLFIENFHVGDEERLLTAMRPPDDADQLHRLLMSVINVLEENPEADCFPLGVITYGSTPCEICRFFAVRLLKRRGVIPPWMVEECQYDSYEDCRKLVECIAGPRRSDSDPS